MSEKDTKKIEIENSFKNCPECGYKDGFHSMFEKIKDTDELKWKFICPNCSSVFDLGLKANK